MAYAQRDTNTHIIYSKKEIRDIFLNYLDFYKLTAWGGMIGGFVHVSVPFFCFMFLVMHYLQKIYLECFFVSRKKDIYKKILTPENQAHFTTFGYEIMPENLESHINKLRDINPKNLSIQEKIERRKKFNLIGFKKDTHTTHTIFIGKTGAGKTATSFSMIDDFIRQGGGVTFIDGKADMKMFQQFNAIAAKHGRECDVRLINLNAPENKPDTNTFNPFAVMNEDVSVEFLGSLLTTSSDGNASYFANRGKAMLKPILAFVNLRKDYYKENFSIETIRNNTTLANINIIYMTLFCTLMELEEELRKNSDIQNFVNASKNIKVSDYPKAQTIDLLLTYFNQNPIDKIEFGKKIGGLDYNFIYRLYIKAFRELRLYTAEIYSQWEGMLETVSILLHEHVKRQGRTFLYTSNNSLGIDEIRKLKDEVFANGAEFARQYDNIMIDPKKIMSAIGPQGIENLPADAIQQHAYSQQQWTDIFSIFTLYDHVFGDPDPDISGEDMLKNNKLTYILLPVLKVSSDTAATLGKVFITSKSQIAAKALGDNAEYTVAQQNIVKDLITPKPLFLIEADEYGAYPVPRVDVMFAQLRSINVSMVLSVQDYTSLRVGGTDETSAKKVWANSTKIALNIVDEEALQKLKDAIIESDVMTAKHTDTLDGNYTQSLDLDKSKNIVFDPKMLQAMEKGAGIIFQKEAPIIFQSFWSDPEPVNVHLTRYKRYRI